MGAVWGEHEPAVPPSPHSAPLLRVQLRHLGEGKTRGSRHLHSAGHATGRAACRRAACNRPCSVRHWHVEGEGEGRGGGGGWLTWGDRTSAKDKALGGHEGVESPFACRIGNLSEAAESARPAHTRERDRHTHESETGTQTGTSPAHTGARPAHTAPAQAPRGGNDRGSRHCTALVMRQAVWRATRGKGAEWGGGGALTTTPAPGAAGVGGHSPAVEVPAASCQYAHGAV